MTLSILNQTLVLSPDRAVFWQEQRMLIVSDLHVGKAAHFRKAGIPIPGKVQENDLQRLQRVVHAHQASHLMVVGDLFHSFANRELEKFQAWRLQNQALQMTLVRGNHDILKKDKFAEMQINLVAGSLQVGNFVFSHHPPETGSVSNFTFCGHLHPGIELRGGGRQAIRLPCFWLGELFLMLPAFSLFTGLFLLQPKAGEKIIAIADGELVSL